MRLFKSKEWIWVAVFIASLVYINYFSHQEDFTVNMALYTVMFAVYIYFIRIRKELSDKSRDKLALFFHLIPLFALPALSPDVYRFIWDGELVTHGIHPYRFTPNELIDSSFYQSSPYLQSLYSEMTELSKANYSLYPTFNQIYFLVPALISENVILSIIIMRVLILVTAIFGYIYLKKLLIHLNLSADKAWIIALNPFIIIEMTSNLHFEGVMLSLLFISFYLLLTKKWILAALFWALAISVKLTPLILLPFLWRFVGWKRAFKVYFTTGVFTILILWIYLWPSLIPNFMKSVNLYFDNFQFNGSIFLITEWISYPFYDYKTIRIFGPLLSQISIVLILFIAFLKPIKNGNVWFERMMWGYVIYLLFATTVHPWYIALPFGLSILTKNTFMIGWTFLIMLSYGFYAVGNSALSYTFICVEYIGLLIFITLDLYKKPNLLTRFMKI
ncbi:MAG: glycosyltransferase family 87 protein [Brumimicrobium sp.]